MTLIMFIVDVIPFSKSLRKESLSYFSSKDVKAGSIVSIDLRKQSIKGLALESRKLSAEDKSNIRKSSFSLRKIKSVSKNILYHAEFLKAAKETADFFAANTGGVISSVTSKVILDEIDKIKSPYAKSNTKSDEPIRKFIIQSDTSERYSHYKNLIRSEFARKKSVLFICPTIEDTIYAQEALAKGIEDHAFVLNSLLTKKQIKEKWNEVLSREKPVLIITTGIFSGIPRHDLGYIVIEKESSPAYKTQKKPHIDIRHFIETYSSELGIKILLGDIMLRSETLWRFDEHQFDELSPLKFRSITATEQLVVDMKKNKSNSGDVFEVISNEVNSLIKNAKERNEQTFLFGARKGLSPSIICQDCGSIVTCDECSASMVLHGRDAADKGNFFKCHVCGNERNAGEKCKTCDSWKLDTIGIGVDMIAEEIEKRFKDQKVFVLDSEKAKTHKQARDIISKFYETPGSVLIGTEMALLYLREPIENAAIITLDSLFSLPDFSVRERILRIILRIRSRADRKFLIQTRRAEDKIFDLAIRGNLSDFYRDEFKARKQFNYPPFSTLIKIVISGKRYSVEKEMEELKKFFEPFELLTYPAFVQEKKGKFIMNGLIKLDRKKWIDKELLEKLKALPPYCKVVVEAESLL